MQLMNLGKRALDKYRQYRIKQDLRAYVEKTPSVPLPADGPAVVAMLCSHWFLNEGIAALKSLYRFLPAALPLHFHDDGTLTARDGARLRRHFPGLRLIGRAQADAEVLAHLRARGLERCLGLRLPFAPRSHKREYKPALKLFDFVWFAQGKAVLSLDSDILFHQPPLEILGELERLPPGQFFRYNQDINLSFSYRLPEMEALVGRPMPARFNSGLLLSRNEPETFGHYERFLAAGLELVSPWHIEQTLVALHAASHDHRPLPERYDVLYRLARKGKEQERSVVSQHYCDWSRAYFYPHFKELVFPRLVEGARKSGNA